jgi:hypothetical protein
MLAIVGVIVCADLESFIHQRSSWSHLEISLESFRKLLTFHRVSSFFLDYVHAFGSKVTDEDDPFFSSYDVSMPDTLNAELQEGPDHYGRLQQLQTFHTVY